MRIEVKANEVRPGDMIWFSGQRKPSSVQEVSVQEGAEKLIVLYGETHHWYLPYETASVFKYVPDEAVIEEEMPVFEDPDGNPT